MKILLTQTGFHHCELGICNTLRGVWGEYVAEGF